MIARFRPATDKDLDGIATRGDGHKIQGYSPVGIQSKEPFPDGFREKFFPWKDYNRWFGHGHGKFYFFGRQNELFLTTEHCGYFCVSGPVATSQDEDCIMSTLSEFCNYLNQITDSDLFRTEDLTYVKKPNN
jgi:hypothetical protein